MTGPDLLALRVKAGFRAKAVAAEAGWNSSRISRIENSARHVEPELADQYVAALTTLQAKSSPENTASVA